MVKDTNEVYESPVVEVMDVMAEGVFCSSYVYVNDWEEEEDDMEIEF